MNNRLSKNKVKRPLLFLRMFCRDEYLEEIEGDLMEAYQRRAEQHQNADWWLWISVFKLIRPRLLRNYNTDHKSYSIYMFAYNVKVSLRSFRKHKASFFINYVGLVGALVTVFFIFLWVNHELHVDRFHSNDQHLYRLIGGEGNTKTILNTNPYFAWELEENLPEVDYVVNSCWGSLYSWLEIEENSFAAKGEFGSSRFFELFSYPLQSGDPASVLELPNAIVLSESMAMKLFQSTDVVGEQLIWRWYSHEEPAVITGIFEDLPKSSSEQFDFVLNFEVYEKRYGERLRRGRQARTYVKLKEGSSQALVNQKIYDYTRATYPEYQGEPYQVSGYADYYLEGKYEDGKAVGGRIELIRLFIIIGCLILLVACINFMNLSTARAALRTKEIGVRKTMGALRKTLINQYLTESCLISVVAGLTALVFVFLLLPFFEHLVGQQLLIRFDSLTLLVTAGIILVSGLTAGSYPAIYLSGFSPLKVLKSPFVISSKDHWFRKGLVVFQFSISLILIVSVIVIYQQMQFIQTKNLGYQGDYIINFRTTGMTGSEQKAFLERVNQTPGVVKAGGMSHAMFGSQRSTSGLDWKGKDPEKELHFEYGDASFDMMELLEIELEEGRFFSRAFGNETNKVVINEEAKEVMGFEVAVGEKLRVRGSDYEIIGVAKNFHYQSLHEGIKPTFFLLNSNDWYLKLAIKIEPNSMRETLTKLDDVYAEFNAGFPFLYSFHDQDQAKMYEAENKISMLTKYATGLAIFISSLGLFGLVSFVAERKSKEMGIRKVLGASAISIFRTLTRDFIGPILIASLFGVVSSVILVNRWLDGFAYRVDIKWWFFGSAIFLMLLIAGITSISQLLKSMMVNPIEALRDE